MTSENDKLSIVEVPRSNKLVALNKKTSEVLPLWKLIKL